MANEEEQNDERRLAFRLDMEKELVDIVWQDASGNEQRKKIACLDFSRRGVKLDCDIGIPMATPVTVIFKAADPSSQKLTGKVVRCLKQDNGWYEIALQLDE